MMAAIPWGAIFSGLLSLVMFIIKRSDDHKAAEEAFLKFISEIEKDVPIKMHEKYKEQIERIRRQIDA